MKKHLIVHTLATVALSSVALADVVAKSETKDGTATAYAHAEARASSTTTTVVNGKPVTVVEDQDENGKKRVRMITYQGGRPKMKDITPKEKPPKEEPAKPKPAGEAKPAANPR